MNGEPLYDDGRIVLDDEGVTLRHYYFPTGTAKHVHYGDIRRVGLRPMTWLSGKGRGWGTAAPGYWLPLDPTRHRKDTLVILDLGSRVKPAITPDDPDRFVELLRRRLGGPGRVR